MYLSSLFLSELRNGAPQAIHKCNEAFLLRPDRQGLPQEESSRDELMALWDVCRDYLEELSPELPVLRAIDARRGLRGSSSENFYLSWKNGFPT